MAKKRRQEKKKPKNNRAPQGAWEQNPPADQSAERMRGWSEQNKL